MLTMQPTMIMAEGKDTKGFHRYLVRFRRDGQDLEYVFLVDNDKHPGVTAEDEFIKATFCDPYAPALYQSILKFHSARILEVASEPKTVKRKTKGSKRASA